MADDPWIRAFPERQERAFRRWGQELAEAVEAGHFAYAEVCLAHAFAWADVGRRLTDREDA